MSGAGEDEVAALREQIADLEAVIEEQADRIDDLEKRKGDAEAKDGAGDERGDPIEIRTDDENPTLKDIWIAGLPFGKIIDKVEAKVNGFDKIEERINDLEGEAGAAGNDRSGSQEDGRSPLAQLIDLSAEKASEVLSENQERGRRVAQRARELGTNTPEGLVVRSSDIATQLRRWGESAHSETVSRVMDFVTDLGRNDVHSKMHKGKRILVFDPERVSDYGSGDEPDVIQSRRDVIWSREPGTDPAPA